MLLLTSSAGQHCGGKWCVAYGACLAGMTATLYVWTYRYQLLSST